MKKKAFTMIEVICCISIITLILSFIYFDYMDFHNKKYIDIVVETLITDLREAKMLAINNGVYGVNVLFTIGKDGKNFDGYIIYSSNINQVIIKERKFNNDIVISKKNSTIPVDAKIRFNVNGSISPHACTIALFDLGQNVTRKITLTIGYTRIMEVK